MVHFTELKSYFPSNQLPLSLEGTHSYNKSVAKDEQSASSCGPSGQRSVSSVVAPSGIKVPPGRPLVMRSYSGGAGSKVQGSQEFKVKSAAAAAVAKGRGGGGGKKVNQLMEMFESPHEQPSHSVAAATPPTSSSSVKPSPPSKSNRRLTGSAGKPMPPPKKPVVTVETTPTSPKRIRDKIYCQDVNGVDVEAIKRSKSPIALFPSSRGNFVDPLSKLTVGGHSDASVRHESSGEEARSSKAEERSKDEAKTESHRRTVDEGGRGQKGGRGEKDRHKKVCKAVIESKKMKVEKRSSVSTVVSRLASNSQALRGVTKKVHPKKMPKLLVKSHSISDNVLHEVSGKHEVEKEFSKLPSDDSKLSTSWNVIGNSSANQERRRSESVGKAKFSCAAPGVLNSSRGRQVPSNHLPCADKKDGPQAALATPLHLSPQRKNAKQRYVNVEISQDPSVQPKKPHLAPSVKLQDRYENVEFCNRDSTDAYENVDIGISGAAAGKADHLAPVPPSREVGVAVQGERQSYENVVIKKRPLKTTTKKNLKEGGKSASFEDDDDMLFGKEGPPGNQETIYENFGPDKGHRLMTMEELEDHVEKLGQKGLFTEYFKIKNEPIFKAHKTCK